MVDVIIPIWVCDSETISVTEAAVESLRSSNPLGRLIIIDNGSTVGGGQLREWSDIYVRNKTNLGYAKAVNQGLNLAGDLVAVANNDIRVSPEWLREAETIFNSGERVGTLHYRMIPYDEPFKVGGLTIAQGRERWCTGSFFVIRNLWRFDENFLNSYDDWDMQTRIRKDGYYTAYTTKACYQHLDSYTQKKVAWDREEQNQKNREYYKSKHGMYPEDLYLSQFPDQMAMDWRSEFNKL